MTYFILSILRRFSHLGNTTLHAWPARLSDPLRMTPFQEFCEVICSSPAVQVQAHTYAKDGVNPMGLSGSLDMEVLYHIVGHILWGYPPT